MFENSSNLNVGSASQVHAQTYQRSGSSSVTVNEGGQYSSKVEINARVYNHHEIRPGDPLRDLSKHIAAAAMHNSADRVDAPKCHKETRKAVQEDIFSWVSDCDGDEASRPGQQILWLTGPAGAGKSAIMGTIADKLKTNGQLAATFFFSSYSNSRERRSKRRLVTTLAYQLQQHPDLRHRLSGVILSAIQDDPAVFEMSLQEQMTRLIIEPLRRTEDRWCKLTVRMVIVVDGVDECGEDYYDEPNRSREKDQIEVLATLLEAAKDSSFPFRLIIASRPETWIRHFFDRSAAGYVTEIFLDNKYNPDQDITLFLRSKLAELSRRYGCPLEGWIKEEDIVKLVEKSSGQFVYAATVIRFVDTVGRLPHERLKMVLGLESVDGSDPLGQLDALYTSILLSSSIPNDTVLWLKAHQIMRRTSQDHIVRLSAWTIERIFESSAGQARMLLRIPSLVYLDTDRHSTTTFYDSFIYGRDFKLPNSIIPEDGWNSDYAFYHKSFLDFLEDPLRCQDAFPEIDDCRVERWIAERISRVFICRGPEVPIHPDLLVTFKMCFGDAVGKYMYGSGRRLMIDQAILAQCDPGSWLDPFETPYPFDLQAPFRRNMFVLVHRDCRFHLPCGEGCKRWRDVISRLPRTQWKDSSWGTRALLLDRFCIKRVL